jgi:hypothetical protein
MSEKSRDSRAERAGSEAAEQSSPPLYPVHPGDPPFTSLAERLEEERLSPALETRREIRDSALRRLQLLEEMHRDLLARAQRIVSQARRDLELHEIPMNCAKGRGQVYYLYRHPEEGRFFSILRPEEYAQADPEAEYEGAWFLNYDGTWSEVDEGSPGGGAGDRD